mgnify:CR=1 FL=1
MMDKENITNWRFDRRIPIALLLTLFIQIVFGIVWATQLNARVDNLENEAGASAGFGEKLARIDERLQSLKQDMEFIKREVGNGNQFK